MSFPLRQVIARLSRLASCNSWFTPSPSNCSRLNVCSVVAQYQSSLNHYRSYSSMNPNDFIATSLIDSVTFVAVCSDTLESLVDYFEQIVDETSTLKNPDVTYGDGVLTVSFGEPYGTYVINRQLPNRQIWLSSPTSGPKRYDFIPDKRTVNEGYWLYRHDGVTLHELLQKEISAIVGRKLEFFALPHSQRHQGKSGQDG
ncbi:frataxin homolog, mitochondrial [Anopheles marshallii]|uniref:frataxin homolog, mitochondrial n=1 Tax=Anopheles marshallii TaxID=1521116 RepID=UPI00237A69E7|nr:frataxin homolog, mitochondrial [Anopheles marshallii]